LAIRQQLVVLGRETPPTVTGPNQLPILGIQEFPASSLIHR
jgi:hypothetical protein